MTVSRRTLAAFGVAGVLAAGAAIPAIAQDAPDDTAAEEGVAPPARAERHAAHMEEFAEALATELGLDTDTVADALAAVREDMQATHRAEARERVQARLDGLVESGEMTQQEADTMAELRDRGMFQGFGRSGHAGHRGPGPHGGFGGGGPMGAPSDSAA